MVNDLDYKDIKFPVSKRHYCKTEQKNNVSTNVFCYENGLIYPVYVSSKKIDNCMDLLLIMCILKILTNLCAIRKKIMIKKHFCKCCLQYFSSEKALQEHKENHLKINGKQTTKLKSGSIKFKNHFKQLVVLFKTYADFISL